MKSHLDGEQRITTNTRLCSDHITQDSFINLLIKFTDNLLSLVNGVVTISRLSLHPPKVSAQPVDTPPAFEGREYC